MLPDPTGWILQEKLDGVFCRWTGSAFLSRNGHRFTPPAWFYQGMPAGMLDGEIWTQRGDFDGLVSAIQRKRAAWHGVTFRPFDLPVMRVPVEIRLARLHALNLPAHVMPVPHRLCAGHDDLDATEAEVVANGGEGLVLREPGTTYRPGRITKVKRIFPDINRSVLD